MTQDQSERVRKAKVQREIAELAAQFNLTLAEYVVLHLVYYEDRPIDLVIMYTETLWRALGFQLQPREEYERALASLLERKHIQLIDDTALASIREMLDCDPAIGPIDGLPRIGTVHFTLDGLALWQQIQKNWIAHTAHIGPKYGFSGLLASPVYDGNRCTIYSMYVCHAIKSAQELDAYWISMPVPIGPWRCRWWDKYPSGFRVECEFPEDDDPTPGTTMALNA